MRILHPLLTALTSSTSSSSSSKSSAAFTTHSSFQNLISQYDAFILDQFGVMHNGVNALDGAVECVRQLHQAGKSLIILSNTSAPSQAALQKLPKFGFDPNHFVGAVTSGEEASRYIYETYGSSDSRKKALFITWDATDPHNPRLTALPEQFLAQCGPQVQIAATVDDADFLLLHGSEVWWKGGDDTQSIGNFIETGDFSSASLPELLHDCAARKLPAICANPDFVVQTPTGGTAYMPGRMAEYYQSIGGTCQIFGKPHATHFRACLELLAEHAAGSTLSKTTTTMRVAHVGDSLHHDIAGASGAGIDSVFVSSGIHASDFKDTAWGELPPTDQLEDIFGRTNTRPTHVVPAFRL